MDSWTFGSSSLDHLQEAVAFPWTWSWKTSSAWWIKVKTIGVVTLFKNISKGHFSSTRRNSTSVNGFSSRLGILWMSGCTETPTWGEQLAHCCEKRFLNGWFFDRFCSRPFTLTCGHESIHLCNNAVQSRYTNAERSNKLPKDNMWDNKTFHQFLKEEGHGDKWNTLIYPTMKKCLISKTIIC